ncbi:uncharacterized protein SPSK_03448 [Sporothrix schenckii 1099-18]|uniref:AB hydrolase-1 domain-containing protein n=2 Tax=Sporothrix schenckii TaxID=29908 RepID=U7PSX0_SPOS1|nr:uncharacterized protein SPSK_03448 [Sporothrix schenckii 1099-18]ERS97555.1 hypothetical protein HMPREF1624_05726 [Sporothrix schenckii ATCC 58251]KJR82067.1 hypothetical protein SPSK_03448 [Sporothrix schenckii 1099-18]
MAVTIVETVKAATNASYGTASNVTGINATNGTGGIDGTDGVPNGDDSLLRDKAAGLNPRFSLPDSTPRSSKTSLVIGGVRIYVYGLDNLSSSPPADTSRAATATDVAVLYLAHNRTRTYRVTEGIAHELLHRYRTDPRPKTMGLIAVTMDMRNHGEREICPAANRTWAAGNERHAMDLLSLIDGGVQDFRLVMDYLPVYLPQFQRLHNVMAGVSLGAHTAWRLAAQAPPGQVAGYAMVVGCPNLTSLLVGRLTDGKVADAAGDAYDDLDGRQQARWPRALAALVARQDQQIAQAFPAETPVLLCNGADDGLVPAKYTAAWARDRGVAPTSDVVRPPYVPRNADPKPPLIDLLVQENTGHSCTKEMVARMAVWLGDLFVAP